MKLTVVKETTNSQTHQFLSERGKHQIHINYGWTEYLQHKVDKLALTLPQEGKRSLSKLKLSLSLHVREIAEIFYSQLCLSHNVKAAAT